MVEKCSDQDWLFLFDLDICGLPAGYSSPVPSPLSFHMGHNCQLIACVLNGNQPCVSSRIEKRNTDHATVFISPSAYHGCAVCLAVFRSIGHCTFHLASLSSLLALMRALFVVALFQGLGGRNVWCSVPSFSHLLLSFYPLELDVALISYSRGTRNDAYRF